MKLDDSTPVALRALVEEERTTVYDPRARERSTLRGADATHQRREQIIHVVAVACAAALVVAVIASLEYGNPPLPPPRIARTEVPPTPAPSAPPAIAAAVMTASGACAGAANLSFTAGGAQRRLDLGARALFVANHGAVVAATQSPDCDLRAALADGDLAIRARDLAGRALVVATARGEVRATGTVFQVQFYAASGELTVGVEEGRVELVTRDGRTVSLEAGQGAYIGSTLELEPFDDDDRAHLRRMLGLNEKAGHRPRRRAVREQVEEPESADGD
jgi:ferric-dicitrate binding protein FerR (iron transport regulator)